jgi:hypothetical protein
MGPPLLLRPVRTESLVGPVLFHTNVKVPAQVKTGKLTLNCHLGSIS